MNFCPLFDDTQVENARQRFPLFYDFCLRDAWRAEAGTRCALVCDTHNTALAVLRQQYP